MHIHGTPTTITPPTTIGTINTTNNRDNGNVI